MAITIDLSGTLANPLKGADRKKLLEEIDRWFGDHSSPLSTKTTFSPDKHSAKQISCWVDLHPGAEPVEFSIKGGKSLRVLARTSAAGPGYHAYLCDQLLQLGRDLKIAWNINGKADESSYLQTRDKKLLDTAFVSWFGQLARTVLADSNNKGNNALCMPYDYSYPDLNDFVISQLGPRHKAWLEAVALQQLDTIDICPWWEQGFGAQYHLGRALYLLWNNLCWREPIVDDEVDLIKEISSLLHSAHSLDPKLHLPWAEWCELLQLQPIDNDSDRDFLKYAQSQAAQHMKRTPIGYRRHRTIVRIWNGWQITLPGSFCHDEENEGTTFLAYDNTYCNARISPYYDSSFFKLSNRARFARHESLCGPLPLEHRQNKLVSRASLKFVEDDDGKYWALNGVLIDGRDYATFTITFVDEHWRDWALETWHSIAHNKTPRTRIV